MSDWIPHRQFTNTRRSAREAVKDVTSLFFVDTGITLDFEQVMEAFSLDGGWPSNSELIEIDPDTETGCNNGCSEMELFVMGEETPLVRNIRKAYPSLDMLLNRYY